MLLLKTKKPSRKIRSYVRENFGLLTGLQGQNNGVIEQIIGREGETATLLSKLSVKFSVVAGGFAPRHLNR